MILSDLRPKLQNLLTCAYLGLMVLTISCSAQTEEQSLQTLRETMVEGKLPGESFIQQLESRFGNSKTGALAKIVHANIKLSNNDFNGAADILNSNIFQQKTQVADYALWLRGKALNQAGRFAEAQNALEKLTNDYPTSLRIREARLLWASAAGNNGQASRVPTFLKQLIDQNDPEALLATAKAFELQGNQAEATKYYRRTYFYGAGSDASKVAEKTLIASMPAPIATPSPTPSSIPTATPSSLDGSAPIGSTINPYTLPSITPQNQDEAQARADKLLSLKNYLEAQKAFDSLFKSFPVARTAANQLKSEIVYSNLRRMSDAQNAFNAIPTSAVEKLDSYVQLARGYANARTWLQAKQTVDQMRSAFPKSAQTPKTMIEIGMIARDQKNKPDETYLLQAAIAAYPNSIDVAKAQFELAWLQHESGNFTSSAQMLTEHLARYADKDTTNRGKAGYWSARDSEMSGKINEACALYDALIYRYNANWYGYLAAQRIAGMRTRGQCQNQTLFPSDSIIGKASANLKVITVAPETSTAKEQERFVKAEDLSTVGLFDWAIDELDAASKTAPNSPKVNLAIAKLHRLREDNVAALTALARSYPDYSQMFPEEMGREEWDIFYPLNYWDQIRNWGQHRNLDPFQVAGFIRQETVFDPNARSKANAYGLMQLLVPTARSLAKKYGSAALISGENLYQPALNIELGTAYIRDQFDKFGRIEYVAIAYNAGPNRVGQWVGTLPGEMDEFVEAIPFKETKGYVQGIIRNSAQYRRLYDENGKFKANVGTKPVRGVIDTQTRERVAEEFPDVLIDDSKIGE